MHLKTRTVRNYGTDHEYITNPELADVWHDITGRKTITQFDKDNMHKLAKVFGFGFSSDRSPNTV